MKKIQIILTTLTTGFLPFCGLMSSCSNKKIDPQPIIKNLNKINILSNIDNIDIYQGSSEYQSSKILYECLDENDNTIDYHPTFKIFDQNSSQEIDWIKVNNEDRIEICSIPPVGTYSLCLQGSNIEQTIKSEIKNFEVHVKNKPIVPILPDKISISIDFPKYILTNQETLLPINISASKTGYPPDVLDKEYDWKIFVISGKNLDLLGQQLFTIEQINNDYFLKIGSNTNWSYATSYEVNLTISMVKDPNICYTNNLKFNISNALSYYDANLQASYQRNDINDNWDLMKIEKTNNIEAIMSNKIYEHSVEMIGQDFALNSKNLPLELNLSNNIKTIKNRAFADYNHTLLLSGLNVEKIGDYAFYNSPDINLWSNFSQKPPIKEIGDYAFALNTLNQIVDLPYVEKIGDYAFYKTSNLSITLGENVKFIGNGAFNNCLYLKKIKILAEIPPKIMGSIIDYSFDVKIYVPFLALETYKNNEQWKIYSNFLVGF